MVEKGKPETLSINGVEIPAPAPAAVEHLTLPSGKSATIRHGSGRDLFRVQREIAARKGSSTDLIPALIAALCEVDGKPLVFEDVEGMDLPDVLALQGKVTELNFPTAASGGEK